MIQGNPCFPVNDGESRVKFLLKMYQFFDPKDMPIKSLCGQRIMVQEKVELNHNPYLQYKSVPL